MGVVENIFGSATHVWFWIAIFFMIIEIETFGMFSIWFVAGSIAALIVSLFVGSVVVQVSMFLVVSMICLICLRNYAVNKLKPDTKTNFDALIGQECVVFTEISPPETGEIKLQGKIWRSKSESNTKYEVGSVVKVLGIKGVTVIVE